MQFLFDNLTASVIGMTVILILSSMQMRATEQRVMNTARTTVQDRARQLTLWLEKDLGQIGKNMTGDAVAFENPKKEYDKQWLTSEFVFKHVRTGGGTDTVKTRYRVESTGESRTIYVGEQEEEIELYRFVREQKVVGSGSGWEEAGGVPSAVEYFDVDLLDRNAVPVSDPKNNEEKVQSVRVRFSLVAPYRIAEAAYPVSRTNIVVAPYQ